MIGTLHFILLVLLVGGTLLAILRFRRKPTWQRALVAGAAGLSSAAVQIAGSLHMCDLGSPLAQWLLPSACVAAHILFIEKAWLRRLLAGVCFLSGLGLSFNYASVVHGPTYVGVVTSKLDDTFRGRPEWHTWLTGLYRRENR